MTDQELEEWNTLRKQKVNGYHLSNCDNRELVRLNHLVMEQCHHIHNENLFKDRQYVDNRTSNER